MTVRPIFWDAYGLGARNSGVYVHAQQLAHELKPLGIVPTLVGFAGYSSGFVGWPCKELKRPRFAARMVTSKMLAPHLVAQYVSAQQSRPAILHGLSNINLGRFQRKNVRGVLTVHDLIPLLAKTGEVSAASQLQFRLLFSKAIRRADKIICVSNWTKASLIECFSKIDVSKVIVIPNGFPDKAPPTKVDVDLGASDALRAVTVARGEPYKRLDIVCAVVRKARGKINATIVTDLRGRRQIESVANDLVVSGAVTILDGQTHAQLRQLYRNADLLLHPSRMEGFCLPAAEALAMGTPVLYQSGSGIDEVVGSQVGIGLPPSSNVDTWTEAAISLQNTKHSATFHTALQNHLEIMKSWKEAAKELKSVYESL